MLKDRLIIRAVQGVAVGFSLMVVGICIDASMPFVPAPGLVFSLFIGASAVVFGSFLALFALCKGTPAQPAGFKYFVKEWRAGNHARVVKVALALPCFSLLVGYTCAVFFATLPALTTRSQTMANTEVVVECVRSGRDKVRGEWSVFQLISGEQWKVAGYGRLCDHQRQICRLKYKQGQLGAYITGVSCEHG
jgi:hypothetical protein